MVKVKESQVYLRFFKDNTLLLLTPLVIGATAGYIYARQMPERYQQSVLLEMDYSMADIPQKIALTDEAVTLLRSAQVGQQLSLDKDTRVVVYKPGPLAMIVQVENPSRENFRIISELFQNYSKSHYPFHQQGNQVETIIRPPFYVYTSLFAGIGLLLGILISLLKTYFKNF